MLESNNFRNDSNNNFMKKERTHFIWAVLVTICNTIFYFSVLHKYLPSFKYTKL
jgi:hypothetical protein